MNKTAPFWLVYSMYGLAILFGVVIIYWQATELQTQKASLHWPTAPGTILHSSRTYVPGGRNSHYLADILYRYEVNGAHYTSSQISLWSPDLKAYDSRGFISAHPTGSQATVYYDPNQFGNAVLIPGADEQGNELGMALGALSAIAALFGIVLRLRRHPVLEALLNAPDAATRTVLMSKSEIQKGINAFLANFLVAGVCGVFAFIFMMAPFLQGPVLPLELHRAALPAHPIAGIACVLGSVFFLVQTVRQSRSAKCPLCGNFFNKGVFTKARCDDCGTHIIFKG